MKMAYIIIVAGLVLLPPVILRAGENSTVQLAGVRIVGGGYGLNGSELKAFNQKSGTSIALIVRAPENKKIVELDKYKCALAELTDDHGQNLLDGVDWDPFPDITKDGNLALVEVSSKRRPSQDASKLLAKGTIHLRVAASASTEKIKKLKLKVGAKAKVRQEVIEVAKVEQENGRLDLVLQISRKLMDNMKEIRFYTEDAKSLEIWSQGSFTFGNVTQKEYTFDTELLPKTLAVEIDLWQELESINLPFEIEAGVGF